MVVGISAIAYFSREPFPHPDIEAFAACLIEKFGSASVVVGGDSPMVEGNLYAQYLQLAAGWIRRADSQWSPRFEQDFSSGESYAREVGE
jgi:hypothetical protein